MTADRSPDATADAAAVAGSGHLTDADQRELATALAGIGIPDSAAAALAVIRVGQTVDAIKARAVSEALAAHRRDWASWLENWDGAVGPEPPTIPDVVAWLRADHLPFGVARRT